MKKLILPLVLFLVSCHKNPSLHDVNGIGGVQKFVDGDVICYILGSDHLSCVYIPPQSDGKSCDAKGHL